MRYWRYLSFCLGFSHWRWWWSQSEPAYSKTLSVPSSYSFERLHCTARFYTPRLPSPRFYHAIERSFSPHLQHDTPFWIGTLISYQPAFEGVYPAGDGEDYLTVTVVPELGARVPIIDRRPAKTTFTRTR
jgi:hypothetical protein